MSEVTKNQSTSLLRKLADQMALAKEQITA